VGAWACNKVLDNNKTKQINENFIYISPKEFKLIYVLIYSNSKN